MVTICSGTIKFYRGVRFFMAKFMNLVYFPVSYARSRKALQWWQKRQSMQLLSEAEKIRDCLLQESFTIRRSLELSLLREDASLINLNRDLLKEMDKFYHYLKQLSDRLSPAYVEDRLPLAIYYLVESWKTSNSKLKIKTNIPAVWNQETTDRSLLILRVLDELLRITTSKVLTEVSISLSLEQREDLCSLSVRISYPDLPTLVTCWQEKDLEYLSQTFKFLFSGECFRWREEQTAVWHFRWMMRSD